MKRFNGIIILFACFLLFECCIADSEDGQKLQANDVQDGDSFGRSVSVSQEGTALIGAYREDEKAVNAGAAYIFKYNSGSGQYAQFQKLMASDGQENDAFGYSVSISQDGSNALIGAYLEDAKGSQAGAAYIFNYNSTSGQYDQLQKLMASDGAYNDNFGISVSISQDGNTALIGAPYAASSAGAVYIFKYNSGSGQYAQSQKITASDGTTSDTFGWSVSISSAGSTALIGAYGDDGKAVNAGAAYIFNYNSGSGQYAQLQKLMASDGQDDAFFGKSVSISQDGSTALIGAYYESEKGIAAGAAYIFNYNSTSGQYAQLQKLMASDGETSDNFGFSVSISQNGSNALIGAWAEDEKAVNAGAAYIFKYNSGSGQYAQLQKLMASDGQIGDYFGYSVSLGNTTCTTMIQAVMIGAYSAGTGGVVYLYDLANLPTNSPPPVLSAAGSVAPISVLGLMCMFLLSKGFGVI